MWGDSDQRRSSQSEPASWPRPWVLRVRCLHKLAGTDSSPVANILEHCQGDIKGTRSRTAHQQVQHVSKVVAGNGTPMSPPTSGCGLSESRRQSVRDEQAHLIKQELRTRAAPTCSGPACHELRLPRRCRPLACWASCMLKDARTVTSGVDVANSMVLRTKQTVAGDGNPGAVQAAGKRWALRRLRTCRTIARGQLHRSSSVPKPQTWNCCQAKADEFCAGSRPDDTPGRRGGASESSSARGSPTGQPRGHETCAG
ncbi:hypothetical protein K466DRAFT_563745 [Polyporus arcularius HHB13444]|uniref:Uncharacterized protein n=1 Tax=Polyporus arcularius HHB13444 TaxID=1314778 RepID=A0A5C3PME9_9APHY|nr:hypothetical protein K466DRAFT_563745 [Polyporus arcularius HHB13444]